MLRIALGLFLLASTSTALATMQDVVARADAWIHDINEADAYVADVQRAMTMARRGEYGRIPRPDLQRAAQAQQEIEALLAGRALASELDTEDRVRLLNAQELITAVLRSDQKDRKVCKHAPNTGSRIGKTECLTVAQREKRALQASRDMREIQRLNCRPGAPLSAPAASEGLFGRC
jgi:hypothetical protein